LPTSRFHPPLFARLVFALALASSPALGAGADDVPPDITTARAEAAKAFKEQVSPFLTNYCGRCHTGNRQRGGVTFQSVLNDPFGPAFRLLWKRTAAQIATHEMPPDSQKKQPSDEERKRVLDWIAGTKRLSPKDPGPFVIRRLNKAEYGNTLHDLFGVDPAVARDLPDEVLGAGYTNTLSPLLVELYLSVANDVLDRAFAPPGEPATGAQRRLLGEPPAAGEDPAVAAREVATSLARLAYRRPPSDAEIDVLMRVFALATENGKAYPEALRLVVKAVLVSPQFLFITPGNADQPGGAGKEGDIVALDDYQLASRLSYLLWGTMPDAELSALADAGKLRDPAVLAAQARRLLADPRSRALFDGFGAQWLGVDKLAGKTFDAEKFPQMTPAMRSAMYDESRLFFEHIVRENRRLTEFIDCDYTFLNGTLAPVYGLEGEVRGGGDAPMRKVTLADANRGGILTMPGVLASSSFPNRTSAVNRGVWVLEQVLGEHIPPPPPDVPKLEQQDKAKVENLTLRQRTELHVSDPACANCHKVLDPIGFGLENFDAIGRWREQDDSGGRIDAAGELPGGKSFGTPAELKRIIAARKDDFCRNLTAKLLAYALGRQLEGYDEIVVDQLADAVAKDGYRMQTLVAGVVTSYPFTHRRLINPHEAPNAK
jgi:hypothetical protein